MSFALENRRAIVATLRELYPDLSPQEIREYIDWLSNEAQRRRRRRAKGRAEGKTIVH